MNFNFGLWQPPVFQPQFMQPMQPGSVPTTIQPLENVSEEKNRRERWTEKQAMCFVQAWKEKLPKIESAKVAEAWHEIKEEVGKAGPLKSVKQCKLKIRNLKDIYKKAKENNSKTGEELSFPPFYEIRKIVMQPFQHSLRLVLKTSHVYQIRFLKRKIVW